MSEPIILREFEALETALDARDYSALRSRYAGRVDVGPTERAGVYRLSARGYVGRVGLPSGRMLLIEPKVGVANLFHMLCADPGLAKFQPPPLGLERNRDFFDFVALALVAAVEDLALRGLYADYLPTEGDLPLVRGRIQLGRQISRYAGLKHRHMCSYAHRTEDTTENRIVAATLHYLPFLLEGAESALLRRSRHLLARFESVTPLERSTALGLLRTVRLHRLNSRYGPVLSLCALVLNHLTLQAKSGAHPFASFLVDMARLFESFLTVRLRSLLPAYGLRVVAQQHDYLDEARLIGIRPDVLVYSTDRGGSGPLLVLDAKYRRLDEPGMDVNQDIYQVNAYLDRYRLGTGVLVYPQLERQQASQYKLRGAPKRLHLLSLDLSAATHEELEDQCALLAEQIASLAAGSKFKVQGSKLS